MAGRWRGWTRDTREGLRSTEEGVRSRAEVLAEGGAWAREEYDWSAFHESRTRGGPSSDEKSDSGRS